MLKITDKDDRLVENFTLYEMSCKSAGNALILTPEALLHLTVMQYLRKWYNKPMTVNSWYRTVEHNKTVGGAKDSAHLTCTACDIALPAGWTDAQWQNMAEKWYLLCKEHLPYTGGSIEIAPTWMHFDIRPRTKFTVMNHKDKRGKDIYVKPAIAAAVNYIHI
jgi:hypothetical protein